MNHRPTESEDWVRQAVALHECSLLRYCKQLTHDTELAAELVQETFVKLCQHSQMQDPHLKCWLFKVCRNLAIDQIRRRQKVSITSIDEQTVSTTELSPDQAAEATETKHQILSLIDSLPEKQQEVLRLKFQNEMTYKLIAEVTELSVSNVGVILHNAINALRRQVCE